MDFLVPKLSATMETVKVLRWLKRVGDKVAMGEPLVELETDKAAMEVEFPVEATLEEVVGAEGEELAAGDVLARLGAIGVSASAGQTNPAETRSAGARKAEPSLPTARSSGVRSAPRILASPLARRLAKMNGADLARIAASSPLTRVRGRDVMAAVEARNGQAPFAPAASVDFEPLSPMRRQIADAVTLSRKSIPSFVMDRWVETTGIDQARAAFAREAEQAIGAKPTFTDFLLLALADSLTAHPRILDRWHEDNGSVGRLRSKTIDIGLVVAVSDGVMIPTLRNLAGKSIVEIMQTRRDAVQRARTSRLLQADLAQVSFSLSNIGKSGADRFEAIIYPNQSGILAVGRQHERAIPRAGGIALAKGANLTLSLDHRLIDGVLGAQFIDTLAERIERGRW